MVVNDIKTEKQMKSKDQLSIEYGKIQRYNILLETPKIGFNFFLKLYKKIFSGKITYQIRYKKWFFRKSIKNFGWVKISLVFLGKQKKFWLGQEFDGLGLSSLG